MKPKVQPRKVENEWKGYVNFSPSSADKEKIVALMGAKNWSIGEAILQFTQSGYSVAFSYDEQSTAVRLSLTGKSAQNPNVGYTLSVRGSSPERCVGIAAYYCNTICLGQDWLIEKASKEVW